MPDTPSPDDLRVVLRLAADHLWGASTPWTDPEWHENAQCIKRVRAASGLL